MRCFALRLIAESARRARTRTWRAASIAMLAVAVHVSPAAAQTADQPETADTPTPVFRAFGSVQWAATERTATPTSFTLGQFDLFFTSTLNERISVLAEIVLEGGTSTEVVTDLERLQLTYRFNDHLHVSAGRYHTGIGFYNATFHHGAYFETPIGRPRVFAFEDEDGVLPVHDVGLTVRGKIPKTGSQLYYVAEVGNGRDWLPDGELKSDANTAKATNLGVSYRPERWRGLEIGFSYYRDAIPQTTGPAIGHRIASSFLAYRTPSIEVLAEWLRLSHRVGNGARQTNDAGYAQASKAWGRVRPYYRYDRLAIDPDTPLIGTKGSYTGHVLGVRLDPSEWVGLKAQYEHTNFATERGVDAVRAELVFVF